MIYIERLWNNENVHFGVDKAVMLIFGLQKKLIFEEDNAIISGLVNTNQTYLNH